MSTSKRTTRTPRIAAKTSYHHGDLRRALIGAALELVRQRGLDGFTLREAARIVGVSQAAPYRHFADKEALLAGVAEEGYRKLCQSLLDTPVHGTPLERLRAQGRLCFAFYLADPALFQVMSSRAPSLRDRHPGLAQAWKSVNEVLLQSLVAAQRAGEIRDGNPMEIGLAISAMVHGLAAFTIDGHLGFGPDDRSRAMDVYDRVRTILFQGLHPQESRKPGRRTG